MRPTRENYQRFRAIMDDGDKFPATFDQWEKTSKRQVADAKKHGIVLKPVAFDPDEFMAFCRKQHLAPGGEARARYVVTIGIAEDTN